MISIPITLTGLGLISLFLWVLVGSFGFPGGSLGVIAFSSLATKFSSVLLIILVVYIASVIGDILAYELALFFSERFRKKLRNFSFFRDNEEKVKKPLKNYEFSIVFFTRFAIPGLCQVTSYVSGFEKINRKKFIAAVITGEFLFAVIYSFIGFFVGEVLNNLIHAISYLVAAVLLVVIIIYLIRYIIKKREI